MLKFWRNWEFSGKKSDFSPVIQIERKTEFCAISCHNKKNTPTEKYSKLATTIADIMSCIS